MVRKILSVYEEWFAEFEIPEEFSEAEQANPTDGWFYLLDWDIDNVNSQFLGFVDSDRFIREG